MTELLLKLIENWGIWGVLISLFIEGSAFPFIGTFIIVTVGCILELTWIEIFYISIIGSLVYALGSYIPYYIGYKFGYSLGKRLSASKRESLEKARVSFSQHGVWSVAITSPLHLGNVVPFLAGMSKMNLRVYTLLTMMGIAPTTFLFLSIGKLNPGDIDSITNIIKQYQTIILVVCIFITISYIGYKWYRYQQTKKK